jgi:hypothetical protein
MYLSMKMDNMKNVNLSMKLDIAVYYIDISPVHVSSFQTTDLSGLESAKTMLEVVTSGRNM